MFLGSVQGSCGTKQGFGKKLKCDVREDLTVMLLLAESGTVLPTNKDTLAESLQTLINKGKIIPIEEVSGTEDEGGDVSTAQVGNYGPNIVVGENAYVRTFTINGGVCLFKSAKPLDGEWDVFTIDRNMMMWGYNKMNNGVEVFSGFPADIYVNEIRPIGGTPYSVTVRCAYSVNYSMQKGDKNGVKLDALPEGLVGVTLQKVAEGKVKVVSACDGADYTPLFADTVDPGMFIDETGKAVTTATYNEEDGTITLSPTTSPVKVAGADVLSEHDVFGIGGIDKYVKVGA